MRTESEVRKALYAALTAKFGDLATATPSPRTLAHFVKRWLRKYAADPGERVIGIRRFRVKRLPGGKLALLLHGAQTAIPAVEWARAD